MIFATLNPPAWSMIWSMLQWALWILAAVTIISITIVIIVVVFRGFAQGWRSNAEKRKDGPK